MLLLTISSVLEVNQNKKIAIKFMMSLLLLLTFIASSTCIVHAEVSSEEFEEITCSCEKGTYQIVYQDPVTSWEVDREEKCFFKVWGTDLYKTGKTVTTYRCSYCGQKKVIITTDTHCYCHGYDFT